MGPCYNRLIAGERVRRLIIGVPRELSLLKGLAERRVGLVPAGVAELVSLGEQVYLEHGAGEGAGFSDESYRQAGAEVVYSKEEVYLRSDLICKVERPAPEEWELLKADQALCGFLHLSVAPHELLRHLIERSVLSLGYDIIRTAERQLPVLHPISEIAGKLVPQIAGRLLERGRGVLLGGLPGIPPADVVILGGGTVGYQAARALLGVEARVLILDKRLERLEELDRLFGGRVVTASATPSNIEKFVRFADVLVGAVLEPGARAPVLVKRETVRAMKRGAVIIDYSIDQGGCIETSRLVPHQDYIYEEEGVIHFCVPNCSSLVARTASLALTNALLPYLRAIAREGLPGALWHHPDLARGVFTLGGYITNEQLAHAAPELSDRLRPLAELLQRPADEQEER